MRALATVSAREVPCDPLGDLVRIRVTVKVRVRVRVSVRAWHGLWARLGLLS